MKRVGKGVRVASGEKCMYMYAGMLCAGETERACVRACVRQSVLHTHTYTRSVSLIHACMHVYVDIHYIDGHTHTQHK
jgi:hypothetical protein